jgi:hypothetical protein
MLGYLDWSSWSAGRESLRRWWLFRRVASHTLVSRAKLNTLCTIVETLETDGVEGAIVECGVYKGGAAALIAHESRGRRAALLRNHGVVIAGEDVRWAVLTAVTLERAIQFQVLAASLGAPHLISHEDAQELRPQKYRDGFMDEYWAAWERRVERAQGPLSAAR